MWETSNNLVHSIGDMALGRYNIIFELEMIDLHTYSLINVMQLDTYFDLEEYGKVSRTLRDQKPLRHLKIIYNSHCHFYYNIQ